MCPQGLIDGLKRFVQPLIGVSFGLPGNSFGSYPLNPLSPTPLVNPYVGGLGNGVNLGDVNVNPLLSLQFGKNDLGNKVFKPLLNFHVTPTVEKLAQLKGASAGLGGVGPGFGGAGFGGSGLGFAPGLGGPLFKTGAGSSSDSSSGSNSGFNSGFHSGSNSNQVAESSDHRSVTLKHGYKDYSYLASPLKSHHALKGYAKAALPAYGHSYLPVPYGVPQPYPVPQPVGVPQPYPVPQPVAVPHPVAVPVAVPKPVPVPQPYPVIVHKPVPVPVPVDRPVPVPQPYAVPVHIDRPVPVPQPYPVAVGVPVPAIATIKYDHKALKAFKKGYILPYHHSFPDAEPYFPNLYQPNFHAESYSGAPSYQYDHQYQQPQVQYQQPQVQYQQPQYQPQAQYAPQYQQGYDSVVVDAQNTFRDGSSSSSTGNVRFEDSYESGSAGGETFRVPASSNVKFTDKRNADEDPPTSSSVRFPSGDESQRQKRQTPDDPSSVPTRPLSEVRCARVADAARRFT